MIIRDKNIAEPLTTTGFSKLPQMEPALLEKLLYLYSEYVVAEMKAGQTYWSMSDHNKKLVRFLNKSVINLLYPYIQLYFDEVRPIVSSFMVKPAHAPNVQFHQDWTFVDNEPNANSFTCWIPLVATNTANGKMGFLPGSHNRFTGYRASPSPPFGHIFPQDESLLKGVEYIDQLAGEPVVFNHRVIHGSLPNKTNADRPALGFTFTSIHNKLVHMFLKPGANESVLAKYAVDEAFYDKYSNAELIDLYINGSKIPDYDVIEEIAITL
jgi:hypothetical protein